MKVKQIQSLIDLKSVFLVLNPAIMTNIIKLPLRNVTQDTLRDLQEKYPNAEVQISLEEPQLDGLLTEDQFWDLIALLDWSKEGDENAVVEPLVSALAAGPVRQIYDFADILSQKLYALDGLKYALHIGESAFHSDRYFSVDVFLYTRCCVVANGREYYEQVQHLPEMMPKDLDFEPLLDVAANAYERKTKRDWNYVPPYNIETYSNLDGWAETGRKFQPS